MTRRPAPSRFQTGLFRPGLPLQSEYIKISNKPWDKLIGGPLGSVLRVNHEEHVGETGAKVGSICVVVPGGLGRVDVHTFGAVKLHHGLSGDVGQAWGGRGEHSAP